MENIVSEYFAVKRIKNELLEIKSNEHSFIIYAEFVDGYPLDVDAAITGPMGTPYQNQILPIRLKFSPQYPVRKKFIFQE